MKNPNGYGGISKLSGKRRKPYMVRITEGFELREDKAVQKYRTLGYFSTLKEAKQCLAEYNSNPNAFVNASVTFSEVWEHIKPDNVSPTRKRQLKSAYTRLECLYDMPIVDIKADTIRQALAQEFPRTVKPHAKQLISQVLKFGVENDIITRNYCDFVKVEPVKSEIERLLFTPEEIAILWANEGRVEVDVTLCLLYSGMRLSELLGAKKENIKDGFITLVQAKNQSSIRTIPIHPKTQHIIDHYLEGKTQTLFYDRYIPVAPSRFHSVCIPKLEKLLGVRHLSHDARHTFITRAHELGIDELTVKKIVGHAPESITARVYTHISNAELAEAIKRIEY